MWYGWCALDVNTINRSLYFCEVDRLTNWTIFGLACVLMIERNEHRSIRYRYVANKLIGAQFGDNGADQPTV